MSIPNWWCFSPGHSDVSSQGLMPDRQPAPAVKGLTLTLKQPLLESAFLTVFRIYHHIEISSCEACVSGVKITRAFLDACLSGTVEVPN